MGGVGGVGVEAGVETRMVDDRSASFVSEESFPMKRRDFDTDTNSLGILQPTSIYPEKPHTSLDDDDDDVMSSHNQKIIHGKSEYQYNVVEVDEDKDEIYEISIFPTSLEEIVSMIRNFSPLKAFINSVTQFERYILQVSMVGNGLREVTKTTKKSTLIRSHHVEIKMGTATDTDTDIAKKRHNDSDNDRENDKNIELSKDRQWESKIDQIQIVQQKQQTQTQTQDQDQDQDQVELKFETRLKEVINKAKMDSNSDRISDSSGPNHSSNHSSNPPIENQTSDFEDEFLSKAVGYAIMLTISSIILGFGLLRQLGTVLQLSSLVSTATVSASSVAQFHLEQIRSSRVR